MSIRVVLNSTKQGSFKELILSLPQSADFSVSHAEHNSALLSNDAPDIVALDGLEPEQQLMATMQRYQTATVVPKLVIYNFQNSIQQGINYLSSGVSGLFTHLCSPDSLAEKFLAIHAGQVYIEPELAQILAMRQIRKLLQPFNSLCSRDFDVFCLLAEELAIDDIAIQLGVSTKTVFNCQTQIKKLLGLPNKSAFRQFAKKHGII